MDKRILKERRIKFLAMIMSLLMVFSMLPVGAMAGSTTVLETETTVDGHTIKWTISLGGSYNDELMASATVDGEPVGVSSDTAYPKCTDKDNTHILHVFTVIYDEENKLSTSYSYRGPETCDPEHAKELVNCDPKDATCTETGYSDPYVQCPACGKYFANSDYMELDSSKIIPAKGHLWVVDKWDWASNHSSATVDFKCEREGCNATKTNVSAAVTETVVSAAGCETDKVVTYTATANVPDSENTVSDKKENVTIQNTRTGHAWKYTGAAWTGSDATGYTAAVASFICENNDTHQPATPANMTVKSETTPATCKEAGKTVYTATLAAGDSLDEQPHTETKTVTIPIDENAHEWDEGVVTTPATCSATGVKTFTCKLNSKHTTTEEIPIDKNAHDWDDGVVTTPATCSATGVKTLTCKLNSKHTTTEEIPIDKNAHDWDDGVVTTPATCSATGIKTLTCKLNSQHTTPVEIPIDENAHEWDDGVVTTPATCSATGVKTLTCKLNSQHTTPVEIPIDENAHDWDDGVVTTPATCSATGVKTLTCRNNPQHTTPVEIPIDENAHVWEFKGFTWTAGGDAEYTVTASFTCKNNSSHTTTAQMKVTSETTPATCTTEGKTVYTATLAAADSPDGQPHTDTKTVTIPIDESAHVWDEGEVTTPATCSATGVKTLTCRNNPQHTTTVEIPIDENAHNWEFKDVTWTAGGDAGYTAAASFTCRNNSSHTTTAQMKVTSETTPATCKDKGKIVYNATLTASDSPDGQPHSDTETVIIPESTEHTLGPAAHANEFPATCAAEGSYDEAATCSVCGKVITSHHVIPKKDHEWAFSGVIWTESDVGGYTAAASFSCSNVTPAHSTTADMTVTSETTPATCTEEGETVYTATLVAADSPDGQLHMDNKTVTIPINANAHDWGEPTYVWSDDYSTCTATRICKRNENHKETEETVQVTETTEPATCEKRGKTTFTAKFSNPAFGEQTKEIQLPALGHDLERQPAVQPTESADGNMEHWKCTRCGGLFLDANGTQPTTKETVTFVKTAIITRVHFPREEPTCEKAGIKECWYDPANDSFYDAAEGGNILGRDDLIIPSLGHNWGDWTTVTEPTLTEPGTEMHTCKRCDKEETRVIPRTGKNGDIHTIGSLQFTIHDLDAGTVYVSRWNGTEKEGEELTIPDKVVIDGVQFSVTGIRAGAFKGNGLIKKLILGERVEVIEAEAFMGCTGLTVLNAMRCEKLWFIGESAFEGCEHLNTVLMNVAALETLEKNVFAGIDEAAAFDLFCLEETENNLAAAAALIRTEETGWLSTMSLAAYRYYDSSFEQYNKIDESTLVINDQIVTHP